MSAPNYLPIWDATYRPPDLPSKVVLILLVLFALLNFGRGLDYATIEGSAVSPSDLVMAAVGGLPFWGYAIMAGASGLLLGLVLSSHVTVWVSHVYSAALNVCLSIMIFQSAWQYREGFTELVLPIAGVLWHSTFVYLVRPNFSETARELND